VAGKPDVKLVILTEHPSTRTEPEENRPISTTSTAECPWNGRSVRPILVNVEVEQPAHSQALKARSCSLAVESIGAPQDLSKNP
jgi:hypothetical protein